MRHEPRAVRWLLVLALAATALVALPYAGIIVLAAWFGHLVRPVMYATARALGGRSRAAALLTIVALLLLLTPVAIIALVSASTAVELFDRLHHSVTGAALLDAFRGAARDGAVRAAQVIGQGASRALIAFALFALGAFTCLVDGERGWGWVRANTPLPPRVLDRLARAFHEVGRGLLVGALLTAATQGLVATAVYFAIGLPHAAVLGGLTFLAAFVPLLGTSTVWVPTAVGLALTGRPVASAVLIAFGLLLIGTVDNLMRPYFARYGKLAMPTWIVALSMFGGLALIGFQGFVLGPVVVRLTLELVAIAREQRQAASVLEAALADELPEDARRGDVRGVDRDELIDKLS